LCCSTISISREVIIFAGIQGSKSNQTHICSIFKSTLFFSWLKKLTKLSMSTTLHPEKHNTEVTLCGLFSMFREELKTVSISFQCYFLFSLLNFPVILLLTKATALCIYLLKEED